MTGPNTASGLRGPNAMDAPPAKNLRAVGDRIEELLVELKAGLDPVSWRKVEETLALVTDLYGGGLAAVVRTVHTQDGDGSVMDSLVEDELVSSLLVLHGLHPRTLAQRVTAALDGVRPYLMSHGGDVEVLALDEAIGRLSLRLLGSCDGCPSSSATLRHAVERAVREAAPEIVHLDVEGVADEPVPEPVSVPVTLGVRAS